MTEARHVFDFDRGEYERPNQQWTCGRASEGLTCALGPSGSGHCGAVCEPYLDGDRYYCNNVSMLSNGCDVGPLENGSCCQIPAECQPARKAGKWVCTRGQCLHGPSADGQCSQKAAVCRPHRSIWAQRRALTIGTVALVLGVLLALGAGRYHASIVSPGGLASVHSTSSCQDCHQAGEVGLSDWVSMALSPSDRSVQSEQKCLSCHRELGTSPLHAHGLEVAELEKMSALAARSPSSTRLLIKAARAVFTPHNNEDKLDCATCHQEHRGRSHDLKGISNEQCQSCHKTTFHSLSDGHPQFSDYPYARRTRIYFDHSTHFNQHFDSFERIMPEGKKPTSCLTCHELDGNGHKFVVRGFEEACSSCHTPQISDSAIPGVVLFGVPKLDPTTLAEDDQPFTLGIWPNHPGLGGSDLFGASGEVPPILALLLLADERYAQHADVLAGINWPVLDDANPEQIEAVLGFADALKQLLHELATGNRARLQARLDATIGMLTSATVVSQLVDLLVEAELASARAAENWFNGLMDEIGENGESLRQDGLTFSEVAKTPGDDRISWYLDSTDLSIRYRPVGHADGRMKRWLDLAISIKNSVSPKTAKGEPSVRKAVQRLFTEMTSPLTAGRCTKCHSIDQSATDDGIAINWIGSRPDERVSLFTSFVHLPHVKDTMQRNCISCHETEGEECSYCHKIKTDVSRYRPHFFDRQWVPAFDHTHFESDFSDVETSTCGDCHSRSSTRDNCLKCHNYHIHREPGPTFSVNP
ncbi:MAG: hypothetical protein CMJ75_03725 [Planctomycetaceae bacterium]|nr:hypothetical protein [Planctomycetaceae bacterium]